ncbi:hypothetical protein ACFYVR_25130 [Rhodococcus sp. NPDC003318]|uniref:hypothetical protein n=1 Tax=Rhodococcus sp. NPDC003318 TaxID=3364503 RepID=UPI00368D6DBD
MTNAGSHRLGLSLSVLRDAAGSDCTLGGITSRAARLVLVGVLDSTHAHAADVAPMPECSRVVAPEAGRPAVAIEVRRRPFDDGRFAHLVPVQWDESAHRYARADGWSMAGGNYATTSDSRFGELIERVVGHRIPALAVHDRVERP